MADVESSQHNIHRGGGGHKKMKKPPLWVPLLPRGMTSQALWHVLKTDQETNERRGYGCMLLREPRRRAEAKLTMEF